MNRGFGLAGCVGVLLMIFSACSAPSDRLALPAGALEIDGAEHLVETLKAVNPGLQSYKGIGRLALDLPDNRQKTRIAWIGASPGKLRVEVLAQPGGQPFASIASDGQWFYAIAHQEGRFVKKKASRSSLKRLIAIPIGPQDVYTFLAGRIPIVPYDTARLYAAPASTASIAPGQDPASAQLILTLKPKSNRYPSQKIYMVGDTVGKVEYFDQSGNFLYRTMIQKVQKTDGYLIPMKILFSDDKQASALIEVERFWTDVAVAPSVFQLSPPKPQHSAD